LRISYLRWRMVIRRILLGDWSRLLAASGGLLGGECVVVVLLRLGERTSIASWGVGSLGGSRAVASLGGSISSVRGGGRNCFLMVR
jgi:hypothetical protein